FYPLELKDLQQKELDCYEKDIEFPEEDRIRKRELLMQGFDWTKKDYNIFIKGMCSIGKDEVEKIAELLEKDKEEVRKYHKIFWERISEVPDYEKIKNQIEKAADQVNKNKMLQDIYNRLKASGNFSIALASNVRSKFYPENLDEFLLDKYMEYNNTSDPGQLIYLDVHKSSLFKYNYFIMSRNVNDLIRRINTLINGLLREEMKREVYKFGD
ncbi:hypothetical protein H311_01354, partial [Anncaliia algerae PRA109]